MTNSTVTTQLDKLKTGTLLAKDTEAKAVPKELFQRYTCPRVAMRIVTDKGVGIKFVNYELLTQDPEIIEFLDAELARKGLPGVVKGEELSLEDRNPEKAMERRLRESIEAEIAAQIEAGTYGKERQLGKTEGASNLGASNSAQTAR